MSLLPEHLAKNLHHRRLSSSTGAIASLASGVSVLFGLLAAHFTPRGLGRLSVALHLHRQPLIVRMAPIIAGAAVAIVTAASLLRFYSWWKERDEEA
jgi:hypothetical protein